MHFILIDVEVQTFVGRKNMAKLMHMKRMASWERQRCMDRNTCPEMYPPPSKIGAVTPCEDGKLISHFSIKTGALTCENGKLFHPNPLKIMTTQRLFRS